MLYKNGKWVADPTYLQGSSVIDRRGLSDQAVTQVCQGYWLCNGAGFLAKNESASMWTHRDNDAYLYGVAEIGAALDRVRLADPKAAAIAVFGPL
jgi:hypothetical protein